MSPSVPPGRAAPIARASASRPTAMSWAAAGAGGGEREAVEVRGRDPRDRGCDEDVEDLVHEGTRGADALDLTRRPEDDPFACARVQGVSDLPAGAGEGYRPSAFFVTARIPSGVPTPSISVRSFRSP